MRTSLVTSGAELLLLAATLTAVGCSEKDAAKCQDALDGTHKSLAAANFTLTSEWRERAYKYCADQASLGALDTQIVDQQRSLAAAKQAEAKQKSDNEALLKLFVGWASDNRSAPDHASVAPKCDGDEADAGAPTTKPADRKANERFCSATRSAGSSTLTARYWAADKTIELFMLSRVPAPASCDDLAPNKLLKTWAVPALNGQSVTRTRCEITSGPLSGLNAVLSAAQNAPVYVFSNSYLPKDPALSKIAGE
jgi:hypothetical protein